MNIEREGGDVMMHVIVQVSADAAHALHQRGPPTAELRELLKMVEELGTLLKPVHPGAEDPLLAPYFVVEVSDATMAEQVTARLRQFKTVKAAYLKPPDGPP